MAVMLAELRTLNVWMGGSRQYRPGSCYTVELCRSSGGRSFSVGSSSSLNLENVFQLAMKISVTLDRSPDFHQKF
eukprot:729021-Rhodomonas_salina.1